MRLPDKLRMRLRMLFSRKHEVHRLDAELNFHLEELTAENIASGMNPMEARQAALRTFGNPILVREQAGDTWSWNRLERLGHNVRIGIRTLTRTPGFALVSILIIAIGIGTNAALFTVVRSVLLKPLPYRDPSRLIRLYEHSTDDKFPRNDVAAGIFAEWKRQNHGFSELAILQSDLGYNLSASGGQLPEKVSATVCSWDLFPTLGVQPALGRGFSETDDRPSASATAILSWGLWKRRFGGDPAILNHAIHLDAKVYTVIGIMPAWFSYPDQSVQLWTPIYHEINADEMRALDSHDFVVVGRLRPKVTETEAATELSLITARIHNQHLDDPYISKAANSQPLLNDMIGEIKKPLYVLLAAAGCLLAIACLNVASLLVARGATRRRELAIRSALGASRLHQLGEQLTESFLLSVVGGGIGLIMAQLVLRWFASTRQDMVRIESIHIDGIVVSFTVVLIVLSACLAGVISSFSIRGDQIVRALQESSRSQSAGQGRVRLRRWLLSLEVGLTVILLVGAGLLLKSYERLRSVDMGCVTKNVLTMQFSLPEEKYSQPVQRANFFSDLIERVRSLPGVRTAGLVRKLPGQGYAGDTSFSIAEHPPLQTGQMQYAMVRWADAGYFAAMGIPILRGHTFDEHQWLGGASQVIISKSFAHQYFDDEDPIGKHLLTRVLPAINPTLFQGRHYGEIVGVVGDTRFQVSKDPQGAMYFPIYSGTFGSATLAVQSDQEVSRLALPIQRIVQQLDPDLAVADILTMDQIIGQSAIDSSFNATLLFVFAVFSLVLAAVGLFGVLSYLVAQRTTEIGIRIALGAQRDEVLRLTLLDGLRPAFIGLVIGLFGSIAAAQLIRSMLYGINPFDPAVFVCVAAILILVATAACVAPAWQASRLDPMTALRSE